MKSSVLGLIGALAAAAAAPALAAPHPVRAPTTPFDAAIDRAKAAMMGDPQEALAASHQALSLAWPNTSPASAPAAVSTARAPAVRAAWSAPEPSVRA